MIERFLAGAGWAAAVRAPLAGDASNRRYERLTDGSRRAVLMDAPPDKGEDVRPFIAITRYLRGAGFSAPEILAEDAENGLLLLEDLGDALFARLCDNPAREAEIYACAVDLLAALHQRPPAALPPYSVDVCLREAELLLEWYLPGAGAPPAPAGQDRFRTLVGEACAGLDARVVVLRDYHAENLLWLPGREGVARVGLLDYQDALLGHPAYDLVSLLEDARRDTSKALRQEMIGRYLAASGAEQEPFLRAYAVLGAQRNLKILGIFARLCIRDGKDRYLAHLPRVWAHLQRDLAHPSLAGLRAWVEAHVPPPEPDIIERIRSQARAA